MGIALPNALRLQMANKVIRAAALLEFDFVSGLKRYWVGKGDMIAGGFTWTGIDTVVTLDLGQYSVNGAAEQFSLTLSGVSMEFLQKVQQGATDVLGRRLRIHIQALDEDFQPTDPPFLVRTGRMRGLPYDATAVTSRSIALQCESIFAARGKPPATYLDTSSQQARVGPNGKGTEYMPLIAAGRTVTWPK
jgi:hypothetical protein